jgi:hypothetical protein
MKNTPVYETSQIENNEDKIQYFLKVVEVKRFLK